MAFGVVAACMSLLASMLGVVTPVLFPLVPAIAQHLMINLMVLFICIVTGTQATSISPFFSGGSLLLGACPDEQKRHCLFSQLLLRAAPPDFIAALVFNLLFALIY
ncbi:hypothetical protein [Celerinatantimonas sp. YJH-8]|uniref:hypothetical protein n=1 Tax=Celerinatantimonas sp. YJH-8 TaxID=3228714 RepID=UPI0038C52218